MSAESTNNPTNGYTVLEHADKTRSYVCTMCSHFAPDLDGARAHRAVHVSGPELLAACKAQHNAIDLLMAKIITLDTTFMPTKSSVWPTLLQGNAAIAKAEPAKG